MGRTKEEVKEGCGSSIRGGGVIASEAMESRESETFKKSNTKRDVVVERFTVPPDWERVLATCSCFCPGFCWGCATETARTGTGPNRTEPDRTGQFWAVPTVGGPVPGF